MAAEPGLAVYAGDEVFEIFDEKTFEKVLVCDCMSGRLGEDCTCRLIEGCMERCIYIYMYIFIYLLGHVEVMYV